MSMIRQSAVYLPSRVIPGALNFLGLLLYARSLGPSGFGRLTLLIGATTLINGTALYWVRGSYLRFATEVQDDRPQRATALLVNAVILTLLTVLALLAVLAGWVDPLLAGCAVLLVGVQNAGEVRQEFLRANGRVTAYGLVAFIRAVVVLPVSLLLLHFTALGFLAPVVGLICGNLAGLGYALLADRQPLRGAFSSTLLPSFFAYGLPLVPFFLVQALLGNIDRFLLNRLLGVRAAGAYGAGYDAVQQSIGLVFVAVSLAGLPLIFKAHAEGEGRWRASAETMAALLLGVTVFMAVFLTLYHAQVSALLLGPSYVSASVVIPLVAWSAVIAGLRSSYTDVTFLIRKQTGWQLPSAALALALNTLLDVLLIPRMGLLGAGVASVTAALAALALSAALSVRLGAMPLPKRALREAFISGGGMTLSALLTAPLPFVVSALLSALTYVALSVAFRWARMQPLLKRRTTERGS